MAALRIKAIVQMQHSPHVDANGESRTTTMIASGSVMKENE
jgi:hypothetical protein